jgi:hypothetical protein
MSFSRMTLRTALAAACLSGACLTLATSAIAAPNDALLEANPQARYGQGMVEVTVDHMNKSLDVFKLRGSDLALGENTGDYQGGTLRTGLSLRHDLWLDAALQRRKLTYGPDQPQIDSWRLGAQWQFLAAQASAPAAALRLSAWGNQSKQLVKSSSTPLGPLTCQSGGLGCVDRLSVNNAKDHTLQADLIGTWSLGPVNLSAFAGAGQGKVSVGSITANASTPIGKVGTTYSNGSFDDPLFALAANAFNFNTELQSINYNTRTAQAGFNLAYSTGPWQWRGGYVLQNIQRTGVDDVIRGKNKTPYNVNHTLVGEVGYKLTPTLLFFTRGQVMNHQFVTEIPFLYNSLTSQRFNQRYGLLSIGLLASFP